MSKSKPCFGFTRILVIVLHLCGFANISTAQDTSPDRLQKGLPFITNYRYQDYNADGVNWFAEEDGNGIIYFANTRGVLIYDGTRWEVIKTATECRSLKKGPDGKIYVGNYGDLGYLAPDHKGKLQFISLKDKLPAQYRDFREVWETSTTSAFVYFRTNKYFFIWTGNQFRVLQSSDEFHVSAVVNDQLYVRI